MKILNNISMKDYSNMKVGGIAKELIFVENKEELKEIFSTRDNIFLIGNGTNTLINDEYLDISFVSLKELNKIEKIDDTHILVEAGVNFSDLISYLKEEDLSGIENLSGIPGSFGGIVNMNAGAYGTEIFDVISTVEIFDGKDFKVLKKDELNVKYRSTSIKENKFVVINATLELKKGFIAHLSEEKLALRSQNHPLDLPNLGSTFKNPKNNFAAQLISDCDLKGYKIGDAQVSTKHPNFITNIGNAKFEDILKLIDDIKMIVKDKTDILLDTEIIVIK